MAKRNKSGLWFVALYIAGVLVLTLVGGAIKLLLTGL